MSSLRTMIRAICVALAFPSALGAAPNDLTLQFAQCTGRLSAQMEFHWLLGTSSDATETEREAMLSLLEAVMAPAEARVALHHRIEAKYAHSRLLTRVYFNDDTRDAAWAADRAAVEIGNCRALILS